MKINCQNLLRTVGVQQTAKVEFMFDLGELERRTDGDYDSSTLVVNYL